MKYSYLTLFFIFFGWSGLLAQLSIQADYENTPLSEVVQDLEKRYELVFSYQSNLIKNQYVTASFQSLELEPALNKILVKSHLDFKIVKQTYIILTRRESLGEIEPPAPPSLPTVRICGTVKDENGTPLPYANVFSTFLSQGTNTDENGVFEWTDKMSLRDTFSISYIGYETQKQTVKSLQECPLIQLKLEKSHFATIIVKDYVMSGIEQSKELNHFVLRPKSMKSVPGLTESDVLQMVQILPGVKSTNETATGLQIRGGTPDQNLIIWDDITVYNNGHFYGMISSFNPYIVDKMKVYRGNFEAKYGGRVAGIVDIQSIQKIPKKTQVFTGINFTHADAAVIVPLFKKSTLLFSARSAYTDLIQSPTYKKLTQRIFDNVENPDSANTRNEQFAFSFYDLNAKWFYKINDKSKITVSSFHTSDRLNYTIKDDINNLSDFNKANFNDFGVSTQWQYNWSSHYQTHATLAYSQMEKKHYYLLQTKDYEDIEQTINNDVSDLTLRIRNKGQIAKTPIQFGYEFSKLATLQKIKNQESPSLLSDVLQDQTTLHAVYISTSPNITRQLKLDIGLRCSYFGSRKNIYAEPRISLFYIPNSRIQSKLSLGIYHQFINQLLDLGATGIEDSSWVLASKKQDFPVTKNWSIAAGIIYNTPLLQMELETYWKKLNGLTALNSSLSEDLFYKTGKGRVLGLDILIKKRWKQYKIWGTYTWNNIRYRYTNINDNVPFIAPTERPHAFSFVQMYDANKWQFSLSWKIASGRPHTYPIGLTDENDYYTIAYPREINRDRLKVYHRLDVSISYKISTKNKGSNGLLGVSFLNLYNRKNVLNQHYFIANKDGIAHIRSYNRTLLAFMPNVVFRWSWE